MNIVVLSPKNRGMGVTTVAYALGIELKNRGEFVQVMDLNPARPSFYNMVRAVPKYQAKQIDGMVKLAQLIRTGTVIAEDMTNCAEDMGVDMIPVISEITTKETSDIISVTKTCQIGGRTLYTIIDLNTDDANSDLFKAAIKNADVCVFVLTQDKEAIDNIAKVRQLNDKTLRDHGIKTAYLVNKYESSAMSLKDIWSKLDVKDTKCWFKLRYHEVIMQVRSKGLYLQFAKALKEVADTDVATIKTDITRLATYLLARR